MRIKVNPDGSVLVAGSIDRAAIAAAVKGAKAPSKAPSKDKPEPEPEPDLKPEPELELPTLEGSASE